MSAVPFELDGEPVEAQPGETIWQVATRFGAAIPHLCHLPAPGYRPDGNCRACMVEVEGERVLAASCQRLAAPGMKVRTGQPACPRGPAHGDRTAAGRSAGAGGLA